MVPVSESMMAEMRKDPRMADSGLSGLGMLLAPSLVEGAVDNFVTPQGVAALVRSGETPQPERPVPADDTPAAIKRRAGTAFRPAAWLFRLRILRPTRCLVPSGRPNP